MFVAVASHGDLVRCGRMEHCVIHRRHCMLLRSYEDEANKAIFGSVLQYEAM